MPYYPNYDLLTYYLPLYALLPIPITYTYLIYIESF